MRVHLHIDRLVLDGIPLSSAETAHLVRALERGLTEAVAQGTLDLAALQDRGGALAAIAGAPLTLGHGAKGADVGAELARSIHAGLGAALGIAPAAPVASPARGEAS
jgi:hypothetical protein